MDICYSKQGIKQFITLLSEFTATDAAHQACQAVDELLWRMEIYTQGWPLPYG